MAHAVVAGGFGVVANGESPAEIATTILDLVAHPEVVERMANAAANAAPAVLAERGVERWRSLLEQLHACCGNAAAIVEPRQ
jgi:glycosyltransferase involved in cell wall biosynthesis